MPPKKKLTLKRPGSEESTGRRPSSSHNHGMTVNGSVSKVSAAVLQKRREGRLRAMERLQTKLDELGIRRTDEENQLAFSSIPTVQLINQKNYYTDYLKKDEQFRMVRQMKERVFESRLAKKKKQNSDKVKNQDIITRLKHSPSVSSNISSAVNSSGTEDEDDDDNEVLGEKVLILHPGSENIRIGLSTDVDPKIIKNVVAYKLPEGESADRSEVLDPIRDLNDEDHLQFNDQNYQKNKKIITSSFKERMRYYKRRIMPNSHESCSNYNRRVEPEIVPDHNDIHRIDYLRAEDVTEGYVVGDDVFRLNDSSKWLIRSPFLARGFNDRDLAYESPAEILGDIELLLTETLKKEFGVANKKELNSYSCIFVIPNMYHKGYVESMVQFLLNTMGFHQISLIEEGLAATFGAGISTGCVVDIGAATTKVCCVEEGIIIPNSQIVLNYGSNDVTRFFMKNLLLQHFPYRSINLNDLNDWELANELKRNFCTFNDANVAVQAFSFVKRRPGNDAEKFQFKVFDEVMVSPMGLFYPDALLDRSDTVDSRNHGGVVLGKLSPKKIIRKRGLFHNRAGIFEGLENDDPTSLLQSLEEKGDYVSEKELREIVELLLSLSNGEDNNDYDGLLVRRKKHFSNNFEAKTNTDAERKNMTPLDEAIIESISLAGYDSTERLTALYSNISLIGGGSKIEGFDDILIDRLNINRSPVLGCNKLEAITELVKGWKDDWITEEKKKKEAAEERGKEASADVDNELGKTFELSKSQLQRITNMVNNSQLLGIEILPNSEVDPATLSWKGGSVFARLKIIEELWLNQEDWDRLGSRSLNYVSLFSY
ncbi:DEKNAAC100211 [Brettanomyces naardenensis]|uniref:DEKNAAC100211 n=1 Tax=Brettanomyces naardenensis TaxID=13370 RepID=A0A448YGD7_BRENA|nr:DEKNAAC100211 [Brettanomyces naardenensis]